MAIESFPELMQILAEEFERSGIEPQVFAQRAGITEDRLELFQTGAWEYLTITEFGAIAQNLDIDICNLFSSLR